jgi:peptidyl-prolyl cis-trans isomerase SDCCAG10
MNNLCFADVELCSKKAPLGCRNFIQLSLEGYYDNTIVHRIIKGFMVQMGDRAPARAESPYGEDHSRTKFTGD